ncbi:helix-turn-helix domain-containing protein [Bartonella taylorii]|uniref:helix-turn-helix domain-containing protein n=1 Tax=Bartonella taylorii TaxID=33046 RepID=UPI001ABB8B15|nr:helix-turn-helix transcriptional regulator [Bartonella taylorii]
MARPELEPKTPLAKRLREIRRILGNEERGIFAQRLNLQRGTLANYEIGAHEPTCSTINAYYTAYNINPHWLVTGEGETFSDMAKAKAAGFKPQTIPAGLMKKLGRVAYTTYRDANIKLPPEDIAELAAELCIKLQELVQDINDMEEIELTLPLLKLHLKRQIEAEKEHSKAAQNSA